MDFASHNVNVMAPMVTASYSSSSNISAPHRQQQTYNQPLGKHSSLPNKFSIEAYALNQNVFMWAGFFTASLFIYAFTSGGDFSFLLTYGALARMFGFGILIVQAHIRRRTVGISVETLQLYCLVFICRLASIFRHEGYLPYDKSGDWLYHTVEVTALAFTVGALWACCTSNMHRKVGNNSDKSGYEFAYLAGPVLIVAVFIHPNLNQDFLSDVAWVYALFLESVALLPQLYSFRTQKSEVELLTAHFVAALGFGRLMEFIFWYHSYGELECSKGSKMPGYLAVLAQVVQLVLMLEFFWFYFRAVRNSTPLILPKSNAVASMV